MFAEPHPSVGGIAAMEEQCVSAADFDLFFAGGGASSLVAPLQPPHNADAGLVARAARLISRAIFTAFDSVSEASADGVASGLVAAGAHNASAGSLALHLDDAGACSALAAALHFLASNSDPRRDAVVGAGAAPLLVAALRRHTASGASEPCAAAACAKALGTLGNHGGRDDIARACAVAEAGGVDAILALLAAQEGAPSRAALAALDAIAKLANEETCALFTPAIPVLVAFIANALGGGGGDPQAPPFTAAERSLEALEAVIAPATVAAVMAAGAIPAVLAVLSDGGARATAAMGTNACSILQELAVNNPPAKNALVAAGALPLLRALLAPEAAFVDGACRVRTLRALKALRNIVNGDEARAAACAFEGRAPFHARARPPPDQPPTPHTHPFCSSRGWPYRAAGGAACRPPR